MPNKFFLPSILVQNFVRTCINLSIVLSIAAPTYAADLPTGGTITAGTGTIAQSGSTMTITQDSAKLAADWQNFSIGQGHTVNFVQPSSDAIALNRVIGSDISSIQGALNANGRVFLINPNGILFSSSAQVNVGGLVASTLNLSNADFMSGNYRFEGAGSSAIINEGNIIASGGTVALIAATIINTGSISAHGGNVLAGAGNKITLDLGGPVKLEVNEGALNTLIEQKGAIRADGGKIYLTTKAAGDLATSVINHTGITEAKTLTTGEKGEIILLGDLKQGVTHVAGTLDASAPNGGDGGFIETSAAHLDLKDNLRITAQSVFGKGGQWLIDPTDYTIDATAAANITGTLNTGTDVTVTTAASNAAQGATGAGNGDITVSSEIAKSAGGDATLSLIAANVIVLNAEIKSTSGKLNLFFDADNDSGTRNGGGVIIANYGVNTNGGSLDFGTGATTSISGVNTKVGGDVYVGGSSQVVFRTGGGNINLQGQLIIANAAGVKFVTTNGNAHFYDIINSGNQYERVYNAGGYTWDAAFAEAQNGTAGGSAVGDQYLATVTSRLENAVVVYTGGFLAGAGLADGSWLGGKRVTGVGTDTYWRWVAGPEAAQDTHGLIFNDGSATPLAYNGSYINWQAGEPNNCCAGEDRLQIGDAQGQWNDLPNNGGLNQKIYIRETNFNSANLEIDAGTGTVTFDEDIGTLKAINYRTYDATSPNPVVTQKNGSITDAQTAAQASIGFVNPPPTVGSMEIVQVKSDSEIDAHTTTNQPSGLTDPTKVFVIDGGVKLPKQQFSLVF